MEEVEIDGIDFIIATEDLPLELKWDKAVKYAIDLGDGWRLPTKDELNIMFINRDSIGKFGVSTYWSSSEIDINHFIFGEMKCAWAQTFFLHGIQHELEKKKHKCPVRLVKSL